IGDVVESCTVKTLVNRQFRNGLVHGLIFGDGTKNNTRNDGINRFSIRFCKKRIKQHITLFQNVTYPDTYNGDAVGRTESFEDLKAFPIGKDCDYLAGFLEGWLGADGNFSD